MSIPTGMYAAVGTLLLVAALIIPSPIAEMALILGLGMVLLWQLGP